MTLPSTLRSGSHALALLGPAARDAEAGDHLVEDEQRARLVGELAQVARKPSAGGDQAHVGREGSQDDRELVLGRSALHRLEVVPGHHDRVGRLRIGSRPATPVCPGWPAPEPASASSPSTCPW